MMAQLRIAVAATVLGVLMVCSQGIHAEYYLEFPEPALEYISLSKHGVSKKRHHHTHRHHKVSSKSRSSVKIEVYYYWPVCPGCVCGANGYYCYPGDEQLNKRAVTGAFVHFHGEPYSPYNFKETASDDVTYDMRTSDDDVMYNPNMNNQYNEF